MPCFQSRRHHHHHAAAGVDSAMYFDHTDEVEGETAPFLKGKARIFEPSSGEEEGQGNNNYYEIQMAIPGVQAHHITIEENKGELEIVAIRLGGNGNEEAIKTYQDVLFLHPSKADLSNLVATVKDGILTIRVPKKLDDIVTIEAMSAPAPVPLAAGEKRKSANNASSSDHGDTSGDDVPMEEQAERKNASAVLEQEQDEDFRICWDLPGVSISSLTVKMHNNRDEDQLEVTAERRHPDGSICYFHRTATVPPSVDMTVAHAYLQDGVFTLVASQHRDEEQDEKRADEIRTFYATPEDDTMLVPEVAALKINEKEQQDSRKEDESTPPQMLVDETVNQEEWEKVDPSMSQQKVEGQNASDTEDTKKAPA